MMEQQLKERLVGATVLVLLGIILIPAILDGPGGRSDKVEKRLDLPVAGGNSERRTVRIPLDDEPRADQADAARQTTDKPVAETTDAAGVETPPNADEMAGAPASGDTALANATDPEPAGDSTAGSELPADAGRPEAAEPTNEGSQDQPVASTQPWTVQVGSFSSEENAAGLVERLRSLGYDDAYISRYDDGSRIHYRVRVGGYPDRERAAARAEQIRERSEQPARPAKN